MEPNNNLNQNATSNPMGQAVPPQMVPPQMSEQFQQPTQQPVDAMQPSMMPGAPQSNVSISEPPKKGGSGGKIALIFIMLFLIVGMVVYILFVKNQTGKIDTTSKTTRTVVTPIPTTTPTASPEEDLEVTSPDAEIQDLQTQAEGL